MLLRACGARPSAEWPSDGEKALRGETRGWRGRRFSRRDALRASAWYGQTCAEDFRFHGMAGRRRVAHGDMAREANAAIAGVQSPPLRDEAKRRTGRLTGKARIRRER